jgi:hypothetical protein
MASSEKNPISVKEMEIIIILGTSTGKVLVEMGKMHGPKVLNSDLFLNEKSPSTKTYPQFLNMNVHKTCFNFLFIVLINSFTKSSIFIQMDIECLSLFVLQNNFVYITDWFQNVTTLLRDVLINK